MVEQRYRKPRVAGSSPAIGSCMKRRSRRVSIYTRRLEKHLILAISGLIVLSVFLFFYGVPLLINFSLFIQNSGGQNEAETSVNEAVYVAPPVIDPIPVATNSGRI